MKANHDDNIAKGKQTLGFLLKPQKMKIWGHLIKEWNNGKERERERERENKR